MTKLNDQRWFILLGVGIGALSVTGTFMALNSDPWPKIIVAGILLLCGFLLGLSGMRDFKPKTSGSAELNEPAPEGGEKALSDPAPELPSRPKTIEDGEDPVLLEALGYGRTDHAHRWEKDGLDTDAPFDEREVVVYDENGSWLTTASLFVVLNDCAWAPGSAKYFKNRNDTDCSLETLLAFPEFKDRLASARHLVFVGVESYDGAPKDASSEDCSHVFLTECRADRLVTRTYNAYFNDDSQVRPELWELDLGYALTASPALEWYQRRALILGIRNRRPSIDLEYAVTKIAAGTKVGTVKLSDYSNFATAQAEHIPYEAWSSGGGPDTHR